MDSDLYLCHVYALDLAHSIIIEAAVVVISLTVIIKFWTTVSINLLTVTVTVKI